MDAASKQRAYTVATAGFEAACKIDSLPTSHHASRLHGHGFQVKVRAVLPESWARFEGSEVDDLSAHLRSVIAPLDHRYLNDIIPNPTNENIARWVQANLDINANKIGVQSTPSEGVDIDHKGVAHIWRQFTFEAAHQLPNVEPGHQCGRMHGHGFRVILHANMPLGNAPMGLDLDELSRHWQAISPELEYACLNDIRGLENPTSEHLSAWLWRRLKPELESLSFVSVYETATAGCHYDGQSFRIWKDFRFESALSLKHAGEGDKRCKMHGHSYIARLHIEAPLDTVMGWTIDYGDVKARFTPALKQLDHHVLSTVEGMASASCTGIASWINTRIRPDLPELDRIDCYQSAGCGAVLSWASGGPSLPL